MSNPVTVGSMITVQDIQAWYAANPLPDSKAEAAFPLVKSKTDKWETISPASTATKKAASPISSTSTVPVVGRKGFKSVLGNMAEFGLGRKMNGEKIEEFEDLKIKFEENVSNKAVAQQLLDWFGDDLKFVRDAVINEMTYLDWALVSNACSFSFISSNSPHLIGVNPMEYPIEAWQKIVNATAWSNPASQIITDIYNAIELGKTKNKRINTVTVNQKNFQYVRQNTQVQEFTTTLLGSLTGVATPPNLERVNQMMEDYFGYPVKFRVVDEEITRELADQTEVTENPFKNDVAVYSQTEVLGRFQWKSLAIIDNTRETAESFFTVGNVKQVDPSNAKTYSKAKGFSVVDTFADNIYQKTNAVNW